MPCSHIRNSNGSVIGHICITPVYAYNGWTFEYHPYCGPWPLRKDGELRQRAPAKFYEDIGPFFDLSDSEKEAYEV